MNLKELKSIIDQRMERLPSYQNPEEIQVRITLSEPSMGARASTEVKGIGLGIDWEAGQLRIEPKGALVKKGNSLNDVKSAVRKEYEGRNYYLCPRCQQKISKTDLYCRHCGQKLK